MKIKSIKSDGIQPTWDIEVNNTHHYALSNGVIAHNTIGNIVGVTPCAESIYSNIYTKSNRNGEFTVINEYLIRDLQELGLWDSEMMDQIKFNNGSIQKIKGIPRELKHLYKTAFEIDQHQSIKLAALRSKWIDQSQSHNIFYAGKSGKQISDIYFDAWESGMKTTYYLRSLAVSQPEKSTLDAGKYGLTQIREEIKMCSLDNPGCESCQ